MSASDRVRITLQGRTLTLRATDDGPDLTEVGAWLDRRLADVAARARTADHHTVALLTALEIARDLRAVIDDVDRTVEGWIEGEAEE